MTLTWDNGQGLRFTRTIAIDENYMFTIAQKVENTGSAPVTLYPYALTSRWETPQTAGFYILHEGPLTVLNDSLKEYSYSDLRDEKQIKSESATGGWIGITDKYWMVALIPDKNQRKLEARLSYRQDGGADEGQAAGPVEGRAPAADGVLVGHGRRRPERDARRGKRES